MLDITYGYWKELKTLTLYHANQPCKDVRKTQSPGTEELDRWLTAYVGAVLLCVFQILVVRNSKQKCVYSYTELG